MYNMEFFVILPTQNILHDRSQALDYLAGPLKMYVFVKRSFTKLLVPLGFTLFCNKTYHKI